MKIVKYEHSCLDITEGDIRVVIDPGTFSESFINYQNIDVLVITHIHGDHYSEEKVQQIVSQNPNLKLFTTAEVAEKIGGKAEIAQLNKEYQQRDITLRFFGKNHAEIDPQTPVVQNIGVLVNNKLYYPGDSFTECPEEFKVIAIPASAPWLRVGQTIPLIENCKFKLVFPTHNALLSDIGHTTTNNWLQKFTERSGKTFRYLQSGESLDV